MTKQKFELTYEDAIKALDCCCSLDNECKQCPVYVVGGTCCSSSILAHFLRNFIERQNSELESLKLPKFLVENTLSEKEISEMLKMGRVGVIPHIDYSIRRIDEVEVVRCEKCKHWSKNSNLPIDTSGLCFYHRIDTEENDYCSYGKGREQNGL